MSKIPKPSLRLPEDVETKACVTAIAELMSREIESRGYLNHDAFALTIWKMPEFGFKFCDWDQVYDKRGRRRPVRRLRPEILKEFKRLTGNRVVWEKDNCAWRKRKPPPPHRSRRGGTTDGP
jgi:hypothetical protein